MEGSPSSDEENEFESWERGSRFAVVEGYNPVKPSIMRTSFIDLLYPSVTKSKPK